VIAVRGLRISTVSGSERRIQMRLLMETRSLPLTVLIRNPQSAIRNQESRE